ncbi:MAG: class I adenylate-forming enzyme family protein [Pseudomonadota bacterium]
MIHIKGHLHHLQSGDRVTGDALTAQIDRRSRVLKHIGILPGDAVVLAQAGTPDFFADLFAVWANGATAVVINPTLPETELSRLLAFCRARAVLGHGQDFATDVPVFHLARETSDQNLPAPPGYELDSPALVLFTSGSTGQPKGVVHTLRSLFARIALNQAHIGLATLTSTLATLPVTFGHGLIGNTLTPLLSGGTVHLAADIGPALGMGLNEILHTHDISFMSSVPALWQLAMRGANDKPMTALRQVHIGSAPLAAAMWQDMVAWSGCDAVVNMYGMTETANWVGGASSHDTPPTNGLVGRLWGGSVAVLTAEDEVRTSGEGEVLVQVPSIMTGYLNAPDKTAEVFRNGWYRTGDIGYVDDTGSIQLKGRARYMINVAGSKVYPEEIDLLLEQHPAVATACCFAMPDRVTGEAVAVGVALKPDVALTADVLLAWAKTQIRAEAQPKVVHILPSLARNTNGKLDRQQVAADCEGSAL